ncbi:uncharacterized protein [Argopecten irradians]|uniref:uncharacterized protein n=1 Tax=Argopecten irradians TaxID=31199 RepID=UPI003715A394
MFVWKNCYTVNSIVLWDHGQPSDCQDNRCTTFNNHAWFTSNCNSSKHFICETTTTGECTFSRKHLIEGRMERAHFIELNTPGTGDNECARMCRITEMNSMDECWLYRVDNDTCFLYFGSQEMSINVTTDSWVYQATGMQRNVFTVKSCATLKKGTHMPSTAVPESTTPNNQCIAGDHNMPDPGLNDPNICSFGEASLSALGKEMENNSVFHMVLKNSSMDVCLTRCMTSTVEGLECQAVLIVTYTSDCSLYYGSNRFTFDQSSFFIPNITVHFRKSCIHDSTTSTTTSTSTTTATTPTMTKTPTSSTVATLPIPATTTTSTLTTNSTTSTTTTLPTPGATATSTLTTTSTTSTMTTLPTPGATATSTLTTTSTTSTMTTLPTAATTTNPTTMSPTTQTTTTTSTKAKTTSTQAPKVMDNATTADNFTITTTPKATTTPPKPRPKDEFNLTVPKTTLSNFRNKYISVYESRPSAVSMGVLGGLLIVVLVALVVVSDAKVIWVHVTTIGLRNIRMGFSSKVANKDKTNVEDDSEPQVMSA